MTSNTVLWNNIVNGVNLGLKVDHRDTHTVYIRACNKAYITNLHTSSFMWILSLKKSTNLFKPYPHIVSPLFSTSRLVLFLVLFLLYLLISLKNPRTTVYISIWSHAMKLAIEIVSDTSLLLFSGNTRWLGDAMRRTGLHRLKIPVRSLYTTKVNLNFN